MPGWRVMHLLYLGGAKGGATVSLYQNGGCDECKVGCYLYSKNPLFSMIFTFLYTVCFKAGIELDIPR